MKLKTPHISFAKPRPSRSKFRATLWRAGALALVPVYCFLQFTGHANAALSTDQQNAFSLNIPYTNTEDTCGGYAGDGTSSGGGGTTDVADVAPNERQQTAFTAFMAIGFTAEQAAGIVGNLMGESGPTIDPKALNSIGAYGIAQWLGGRKDGLTKLADYDTFGVQLNYLIKTDLPSEDKTYHVIARVKAATTVGQAAFAWEDTFERAGDKDGDADIIQRTKYGNEVLKSYGTTAAAPGSGTSTVTPVSDTTSTCSGTGGTATGIGTGTGAFTTSTQPLDGTSAADVQAMLARTQQLIKIKPPSSLFLAACPSGGGQVNCSGMCDHLMGYAYGYSSSGYKSAQVHWDSIKAQYGHPLDRNPPIGALLFYSNSSGFGHIVIYVGNNEVFSNDIGDPQSGVTGGAYIVSADKIEKAGWNLQYLGWASPHFNSPKY